MKSNTDVIAACQKRIALCTRIITRLVEDEDPEIYTPTRRGTIVAIYRQRAKHEEMLHRALVQIASGATP